MRVVKEREKKNRRSILWFFNEIKLHQFNQSWIPNISHTSSSTVQNDRTKRFPLAWESYIHLCQNAAGFLICLDICFSLHYSLCKFILNNVPQFHPLSFSFLNNFPLLFLFSYLKKKASLNLCPPNVSSSQIECMQESNQHSWKSIIECNISLDLDFKTIIWGKHKFLALE